MVYALLADEMRGAIHALALTIKTPAEWGARQA
jgi:stress-induced morphogen